MDYWSVSVSIGDVVGHLYRSKQTGAIGRSRGSDSTVDQSRGTDELPVLRCDGWMKGDTTGQSWLRTLLVWLAIGLSGLKLSADLEDQTKSRSISRDR